MPLRHHPFRRCHRPAPVSAFATRSALAALLVLGPLANADDEDPAQDELRTTPVAGAVSLIAAVGGFGGGNVAASIGPDGVLLVDTMSAGIAPKLKAELARLTPKPVRIVVNTHQHLDHAGGNAGFGTSSTLVAHENVRRRLAAAGQPASALAPVTYADASTPTLHFNGEDIRLIHCPAAHTDGDTIVYFEQSRVVHFGDVYFNGMFPAVYRKGGGDWKGLIACVKRVLPMLPEDAAVIGGHGPLARVSDLRAYLAMLEDTTAIVERHMALGESAAQMNERKILARYDALGDGGAQTTPQYVEMLVKLLSPAAPEQSGARNGQPAAR